LKARGKEACFLPDVDSIVQYLGQQTLGGDVVCVFTNGGFGNIHAKLLERLGKR
jgi:UDP-N-acetylmuramate: L-alanyl-gamma-D-glutamyl-meso-diaminopimelate ligase